MSRSKCKVSFRVYVTDHDIDPTVVGTAETWIENNKICVRMKDGDPYFVYNCVKEVAFQENIERRNKRRMVGADHGSFFIYIARVPELFTREIETVMLPPKYRFSSSPRIAARDETGLSSSRMRRLQDLLDNFDVFDDFIEAEEEEDA